MKSTIKQQILKSPNTPGVYFFKNAEGKVIYVGKAIKLKARLKSYIDVAVLRQYPKTRRLMENAANVEFFETNTEIEALVLESNLIKKYKPKYNFSLKDDKAYKYILIKKSKNGSYKIGTIRKTDAKTGIFGPFPSGAAVNTVLRDIRKLFSYRDCSETKFNYYKSANRPCLYGYIGLCPAPCQGKEAIEQNNKNIQYIKRFLQGDYKTVLNELKRELRKESKNLEYEKAAKTRDRLKYYEYLSTKYKSSQELILDIGEIEKGGFSSKYLIDILSFYFPKLKDTSPTKFRIEFFDISNTGSEIIVGSQITMVGERFDKDNYRKYKIRNQKKQNDFSAMFQMLSRRMNNISKWGKPDLIVIDGGKGQLSSVLPAIQPFDIPVISIAKREEILFLKHKDKYVKLELAKSDPALSIIIKGRDETHRFGVGFNRHLRSKLLR